MANYDEVVRSNYFKVNDVDAFKTWCDLLGLAFIEQTDAENGHLVGFMNEDGDGVPDYYHKEGEEEETEIDFWDELVGHLRPGEVAVVQGIGQDKMRYLSGWAMAVNSDGEHRWIELSDIYEQVNSLGKLRTTAEY